MLVHPSRCRQVPEHTTISIYPNLPWPHFGWASAPQEQLPGRLAVKAAGCSLLGGSVPTAACICNPAGELAWTRAVLMDREASGHVSFISIDTWTGSACPWVHTAPIQKVSVCRQCCTQRAHPADAFFKLFFKTKLDWTHSPKGVGGKAASHPFYYFHSSAVPEAGVVSDIIRALLLCL